MVADQRDLEIQDPCAPGVLDEDWRLAARKGRELLKTSGYTGRLGIHGAYDGIDLSTRDKKVREVIALRYQQSLEFGAELGATHMVIHSPFMFFGNPFVHYSPASERQYVIEAAHAALENVLPMAEKMGCTLVMEVCYDSNPHPLLELVRSFNSPCVRASLDAGHAFIMQRIGGPTPDQWVLEMGDLLEHLHLQDTDGHGDRHWPLGDGNVNWRALFRALRTLNHRPRLILEIADIIPSANWLAQQGLAR